VLLELGLDGNEVSPETFPLPTLGVKLGNICTDVYEGRGFAILRGLDPDAYPSVEDLTVVYLGISSYIGNRRGKQDQLGSMLSEHTRLLTPIESLKRSLTVTPSPPTY
jgi:hypothetical protein